MPDKIQEQFSQFYDKYIQKIYRFVYLKVNSEEAAQDITSKVFLKAWESYKKDQNIANFSAFLYKIAGNCVVDFYRERGRTSTISADALPELADRTENAQNKAILSADLGIIKNALQKVKKEHQDIIIWHYLDDMPIGEIAKLVDKPEGTVRVMLHRGLKELKDVINQA